MSNPVDINQSNKSQTPKSLYGTKQGSTYSWDFTNSPEYQAALAKYSNHPLMSYLTSMSSLKGSRTLSVANKLNKFFGGDPGSNYINSAYDNFRQDLQNVIQQLDSTTYNNEQNTAARQAMAGYNPDLTTPGGSPAQDVEQPLPGVPAVDDSSVPFMSVGSDILGAITGIAGIAQTLQSVRAASLENGLKEVAIDNGARGLVLQQVLDRADLSNPNVLSALSDVATGEGKIEGSDAVFDSIIASSVAAMEKSPYSNRQLRNAMRRYRSSITEKSSTVRRELASRLKDIISDKRNAADIASRPDYDDDFGKMISKMAGVTNKYYGKIIEYQQKIREYQEISAKAESHMKENESAVSDEVTRNKISEERVTYRDENGNVRNLGHLRGLTEAQTKEYERYKAKYNEIRQQYWQDLMRQFSTTGGGDDSILGALGQFIIPFLRSKLTPDM